MHSCRFFYEIYLGVTLRVGLSTISPKTSGDAVSIPNALANVLCQLIIGVAKKQKYNQSTISE